MDYGLARFLEVGTWHTFHPSDQERFYLALSRIIGDPHFNVAKMAEEIRARGYKDGLDEDLIEKNVAKYLEAASIVDSYLRATGEKKA